MRVLENHDERLLARHALDVADQRLQGPLLLALRAEVRQRMALRNRQRQQVGEERHIFVPRRSAGEQDFEFLQLGRGWVVAYELRSMPELVDKRIECAVAAIGRAEIAQTEMRLGVEPLLQLHSDARLANTGLARNEHDLAVAHLGTHPATQQKIDLL